MKHNRDVKRKILLEMLGGRCASCGTPERLHFHHKDPSEKLFSIGARLGFRLSRLVEEAQKCELLCTHCHARRTRRDNGFRGYVHGTVSMYANTKCRCKDCRRANATSVAEWYKKNGRILLNTG